MRVVKDMVGGIVRRVVLLDGSGHEVVPVARFLAHLSDSGYSPNTLCSYGYDLIRARTREGMAAKAKGRLRGKPPKLSKEQEAHLVSVHRAGTHTTVELAELFAVARSTLYRAIKRAGDPA